MKRVLSGFLIALCSLVFTELAYGLGPFITSNVDTDGYASSVYISGNYVYVADGDRGLKIIVSPYKFIERGDA